MCHPVRRFASHVSFFLAAILAVNQPGGATAREGSRFLTGLGFEHFSRTIRLDGDEDQSRLKSLAFSLREDISLGENLGLTLKAGLSTSSFDSVLFTNLPISIDYRARSAKALELGAEFRAVLFRSGDFEIMGVGRIVSSMGLDKTWPLEGFAVDGEARSRSNRYEASVGPKITYLFFGKFRPYLFVYGDTLWGNLRVKESLEDLSGAETRKMKGKSVFGAAFGASFEMSPRLFLQTEAGFLPYPGGVDASVFLGTLFIF